MKTSVSATIDFARGGNSLGFTISGWSATEPHHTCVVGYESSLCVDAPNAPFGYFIEVDWYAILNPPFRCSQPVKISVNGRHVKTCNVTRAGAVAFWCPPPPPHERRLLIRFEHPEPIKPCDFTRSHDSRELSLVFRRLRLISLSEPWRQGSLARSNLRINSIENQGMIEEVEATAAIPLFKMLGEFEMLAGNCDMGLALRSLGFENLSLLRFAGGMPEVIDRALETDFRHLGDDIKAEVAPNPMKEWMIRDEIGLRFHSGQSSEIVSEADVLRKFKLYASVLRRKFLEDVSAGSKIFVYADHKDYGCSRDLESVLPLFLTLRRRSNARMLWVCPASSMNHLRGSVQEVLPGLAVGLLDILAPPVLLGGGMSVSGWLTVLLNAWMVLEQPSRAELNA